MDFGIVDCHAHIFPPLAGACGLPDAATDLVQQQRAMHVQVRGARSTPGALKKVEALRDQIVSGKLQVDDPAVAG